MLFKLFAPQGLKCPAAAIQGPHFGEIGKFARQITKSNFTAGHTRVFRHLRLINLSRAGFRFSIWPELYPEKGGPPCPPLSAGTVADHRCLNTCVEVVAPDAAAASLIVWEPLRNLKGNQAGS